MPRRPTRKLSIDPDDPGGSVLDEAAQVLRAGGLVAFATETVYGLGADATNPEAVARIFEAKGRPSFNPLIVHADNRMTARSCVADWPPAADALAAAFWPGPLTLVLPRSAAIPDIVTAGRETVGVRVPRPPIARALIAAVRRPLAAPSANRSNGISPTTADHVLEDLDGKIDLVLDSGPTTLGLESTVVDLTTRHPRILRPGPIAAKQLEHALGGSRVHEPTGGEVAAFPSSPGQLATHYAPRSRAVRVDPGRLGQIAVSWPSGLLVVGPHEVPSDPRFTYQYQLGTPEHAAHAFYNALRACDRLQPALIVIVPPPDLPEWRALRDRIWRATTPWVEERPA